ncbi:cysteine peptidase family C39 domain-containing protein [Streptomyces sp. SD15]
MSHVSPLVDSSCYHAAVAALLRSADPQADPSRVLGNSASTGAVWDAEGRPVFGEPFVQFSAMAERRGYRLLDHRVRDTAEWREALGAVAEGRTVAIAADAFHLKHFWPGYGRSHALHAIVISELDPVEGTVHVLDPGQAVYLDGRLPVADLEAAMCREDTGQSWMEVRRDAPEQPVTPTPGQLAQELAVAARELTRGHDGYLGGAELVDGLRNRLDDYVELVAERPRGAEGNELSWGVGQGLVLGLWWYHHVLRWFSRYLGLLADDAAVPVGPEPAAGADRACRDILVVRNLLMRLGVMPRTTERAREFRRQIGVRLVSAYDDLHAVAAQLTSAVGVAV